MHYGYWGNMMGWGYGFTGWIFTAIFWILIILGIVALVRHLGAPQESDREGKTPMEILKERYARGEIDRKEYEEKKKDLA